MQISKYENIFSKVYKSNCYKGYKPSVFDKKSQRENIIEMGLTSTTMGKLNKSIRV